MFCIVVDFKIINILDKCYIKERLYYLVLVKLWSERI